MSQDHIDTKEIQMLKFNQIDDDDDNDDVDEIVHIQIIPKNDFKINYYKLQCKSKLVQQKYHKNEIDCLSNDLLFYQQKHNIKDENIISFFNIIDDKKDYMVMEEYFDYLKLNQMLKIKKMQKILRTFTQKYINDINFVIKIINDHLSSQNNDENDDIMPEIEKVLSENINACLINEQFGNLPISSIYRIISNNFELNQDSIDDDLLFNFINGSIRQRYILFSFLNPKNLSEENLNSLDIILSNPEDLKNYNPLIQYDLKSIIENRKLKEENAKLIEENEQLKEENSKLIEENKNEKTKLNDEIELMKEEKARLIKENEQVKEENAKLIKENEQVKEENAKLIKENEQVKEENVKLLLNKEKFLKELSLIWSILCNLNKESFLSIQPNFNSFKFVPRSLEEPALINLLNQEERRLCIASQSSDDIYNVIDPKTNDYFSIYANGFISFELPEKVIICGFKVFSATFDFPKTFNIEIDGETVHEVKEAIELDGENKEMTININPKEGKVVKFVLTGPQWEDHRNKDNVIHVCLKRFEILSEDQKYSKGVFDTLVQSCENQDPHKCNVLNSASLYDFNSFYLIDNTKQICTCGKKEKSWFQIELTKGLAVISHCRIKMISEDLYLKSFRIVGSNDCNIPVDEWKEIYSVDDNKHELLDIYEFPKPSPPIKYVRLIMIEVKNPKYNYLAFYHLDFFGYYFPN